LIDGGGIDLRALEYGPLRDAEEIRGMHGRESAAALSERGASGFDDVDGGHGVSLLGVAGARRAT
jgi:hypothetical protein